MTGLDPLDTHLTGLRRRRTPGAAPAQRNRPPLATHR
ncbi:hypothetical protein FHU28_002689 [Micromonospora echinospora]|uniref:Uncharacterized protein n=1 Tax=Micromonospora echinospora TaxID=1877 RepID=A0ABR6MDW7_MICEC|nr:hypothetical protein [Micromonospora echinospora]